MIILVVANVLESDIVQSKFEFQSRDCIHFRTNIHEKNMNTLFFLQLWVK